MENIRTLNEILNAFSFEGTYKELTVLKSGHINNTFVVTFETENSLNKYLVQQINTYVFKKPEELMENMLGVTEHLRKKLKEAGEDENRGCLRVYLTKSGAPFFKDSEGGSWRVLNFIDNSHSEDVVENPEVFYNAARAFGKFQCLLADYPINTLFDTIPNFHNTVSRFSDFKEALYRDVSGRVHEAAKEAAFVLERQPDCGVLTSLIATGELPLRVTHNDTKLNNVMMDDATNEGICVVDLDTVMPGLSLYDFGDSIRFGANTAAEDEKDLSKVSLSLEYFEAFTKGWLETAGSALCKAEIDYLPFSAKLMTLECGMRFLGDYFNGDVYFKTDYPNHNLIRARTQFKLVEDIEAKMPEMQKIVEKCRIELGL